MGNWNWRPRRRPYRQKFTSSPPTRWCQPDLPPSGGQDNVPSWEKKFCSSVGSIPWWKVVDAKKFMHCHSNILNWDDSAGEVAFHNAKKRFWAEINGLPCDICLPDPDSYIDKIDWNPYIDSELVLALDREYVCPDEVEKGTWKNSNRPKNPKNGDNPWDCSATVHGEHLKIQATGWGQWSNIINESQALKYDDGDPWKKSFKGHGVVKENAWGDLPDKSRDWTQEKRANQSKDLYTRDNPRGHSYPSGNGAMENKAWGDWVDNSWGRNEGENYIDHLNKMSNSEKPRKYTKGTGAAKKPHGISLGDNSWDGKQGENSTSQLKDLGTLNNPWEHNYTQANGAVKKKMQRGIQYKPWGWNQEENRRNQSTPFDYNVPWGCSHAQSHGAMKATAPEDRHYKSRCWNQGENGMNQSNKLDNGNNPWDSSCEGGISIKDERWGSSADSSWGQKQWGNGINESENLNKSGNPWECGVVANNAREKDGGRRDHKQWENNCSNEPKNLESKTTAGWGAWNGGSRKREGPLHYMPRYKNSRFQRDEPQRAIIRTDIPRRV